MSYDINMRGGLMQLNDEIYRRGKDDNAARIFALLPDKLMKNNISRDIELFCRLIRSKWIENDFDCPIAITGMKGLGKSTLALRIAIKYYQLYIPHHAFNIRKNILYETDSAAIFRRIKKCVDGDVIIFDEASRILLAEDWAKGENKLLKKIFGEIRTKHLLIIFTCPFQFVNIDAKYRNSLIKYWVHLLDRKVGIIFQQNVSPNNDAYYVDWFKNKVKFLGVSEKFDLSTAYNLFGAHPCFYRCLTWRELPERIYFKYKEVRDKFVFERNIDEEIAKEKAERFDKNYETLMRTVTNLREHNEMSIENISKVVGVSKGQVYTMLKKTRENDKAAAAADEKGIKVF